MNRKGIAAFLAAVMLCAGLTGCGENAIPDMTDEQVKDIGEYVAITMMKYDANHRSRLVDRSRLDIKPSVPAEPVATKAPSGIGEVDNTPVIDSAATENSYSMEEVLALPAGVTLSYTGHDVCDVYPNTGEIGSFSASASEGQKFLVLKYMLSNTTGQEQKIDLLSFSTVFRITVNGSYSRNAIFTGLPEELKTYFGTLPANSNTETVILVEVDEETASGLESISLTVKSDAKSCTVRLL